jgi:hypothetical protein
MMDQGNYSMARPSLGTFDEWLRKPLTEALGRQEGALTLSALQLGKLEDGTTTALLLSDSAGDPYAVVLVSSALSPDLVQRSMACAHQAKTILGPSIGAHILDPLVQGVVNGLSYAVLPFCKQLSSSKYLWLMQRKLVCPSIFDWLWRATTCTLRNVSDDSIDQSFGEPLRFLASLTQMSTQLRAAASHASGRLATGAWKPKYVLMHGDLWKGNILIRHTRRSVPWLGLSDRFVVTDWAGLKVDGYAMLDLIVLAKSVNVSERNFRREVERHRLILQCEPADALSYLLAGLGTMGMTLEHFPFRRFRLLAEICFKSLENVTGMPHS